MAFDIKTDFKFEIYVPPANVFVLGISELGSTKVLSSSTASWVDIGANMVSVNINHGPAVVSGVYTQSQPGTLTASFQSATYDPNFNRKIRPGVPVKVSVKLTSTSWMQLFYGSLASLDAVYNYDGSNIVSLTANDPIFDTFNETAMGFSTAAGARTDAVISSAFSYLPVAPYFVTDTGVAKMSAMSGDMDLGTIINSAALVELGLFWYEPAISGFYFRNRNFIQSAVAGTPVVYFSDVHSTSSTHSCYQDIQIGTNTDLLVNNVFATYADASSTHNTYYQDSIDLYGNRTLRTTLDINKVTGNTEILAWNSAAVVNNVQQSVQAITYKATNRDGSLNDGAATVHVSDCVNVVKTIGSDTINQNFMVVNISHTIEPTTWQISLGLWKGL